MAEPTGRRNGANSAMTPLYARLPRGPHRLERGEVAENQRQRMHGAMVEAVASHGYEATSVKQVISLAGVSRRAFYEQFSNKQECFLSALELLASRAEQRIAAAYRSQDGDLDTRMRAALRALTQMVIDNPKSAHMVLVDAPLAGAAGWTRLTKTLQGFERALAVSFARTPGGSPLAETIARAIVGGLYTVVFAHVHQRRANDLPSLTEDMLRWALAFNSPAAMRLLRQGSSTAATRTGAYATALGTSRRGAGAGGARTDARVSRADPERSRLLDSALEMIAVEGYGNLSALRIVDRADTSIDTFFTLFGDVEGCALAALAELAEDVRRATGAAETASGADWPLAVRGALHSLMQHFAEHPSHAHMLVKGAFEVGSPGIDLSMELGAEVARGLTAAAEGVAGDETVATSELVRGATAGAIWHTVYCHTALQRIDRLPAVADDLTFVVLAPFLGAEQAAEALRAQARRNFQRLPELGQRMAGRQSSRAAL